MKIKDYVNFVRFRKNIKLQELAKKMNIPYSTLINKVNRNSFKFNDIVKIGNILELDLNELKKLKVELKDEFKLMLYYNKDFNDAYDFLKQKDSL